MVVESITIADDDDDGNGRLSGDCVLGAVQSLRT